MKRIYYVHDGRTERLVKTTHPSRAVAHVARSMKVRVATQEDLETLLPAGIKVETDADAAIPAAGIAILRLVAKPEANPEPRPTGAEDHKDCD